MAIITTVEAVHFEFFKSVEEIADAKAEIFCAMGSKNSVVLNLDNPHYKRLQDSAKKAGIKKIASFGEKNGADFQMESYSEKSGNALIKLSASGEEIKYRNLA